MDTTLITGVDGSGKSTLLAYLENQFSDSKQLVINLPHSKLEQFTNQKLNAAAVFIHDISKKADAQNMPSLKALALFSSILLFKRIVKEKVTTETESIFCERHPIIDTGIYAAFYAEKLGTTKLNSELKNKLDRKYENELRYILKPIWDCIDIQNGIIQGFVQFLYTRFHLQKKNKTEDLIELFHINLPDKIYYLQADAEKQFERISSRNYREAHESIPVFRKLNELYAQLFTEFNQKKENHVTFINANLSAELNALQQKLVDGI